MVNGYLTAKIQAKSDVKLSVDQLIGLLELFAFINILI